MNTKNKFEKLNEKNSKIRKKNGRVNFSPNGSKWTKMKERKIKKLIYFSFFSILYRKICDII
jgi:hypothetical protein